MSSVAAAVPHAEIRVSRRWEIRELVVLGVFAAAAKASTLVVALIGGGMNPISLMVKSCLFTTLLVVLLFKIRKPGILTLFITINCVISLMLLGMRITLLVPMVLGAVLGEVCMWTAGGQNKSWGPFVGAAVYDFTFKALAVFMSWLVMRENPVLVYMVAPFVAIGWLGSVGGLFLGHKAVKELRHAGFVTS